MEQRYTAVGFFLLLIFVPLLARIFLPNVYWVAAAYFGTIILAYLVVRTYPAREAQSNASLITRICLVGVPAIVTLGSTSVPLTLLSSVSEFLLHSFHVDSSLTTSVVETLNKGFSPSGHETIAIAAVTVLLTSAMFAIALSGNDKSLAGNNSAKQLAYDRLREVFIVHFARLEDEYNFLPQATTFMAAKIEELDKPTFGFRQTTLRKRVLAAKPNSIFILKGDPGSGKSVALRYAARSVAEGIAKHKKIPIYLNLRDWFVSTSASQSELDQSLATWIADSLDKQFKSSSLFTRSDYEQAYALGQVVFFFDSFDEISAVIGSHHNSHVIQLVSNAIGGFIKSSGGCRAVIASREYKAPVLISIPHTLLAIRAFNDRDVRGYARAYSSEPAAFLRLLYNDRPDLFPMSRNPFLLALLVYYFDNNHQTGPATEFDLYENFIRGRLEFASGSKRNRAIEAALEEAGKIAQAVALSDEVAVRRTSAQVATTKFQLLLKSRLISFANGGTRFAHRRLQEFFRARAVLREEAARPALSQGYIDQNYDLLALYAGVCDRDEAQNIFDDAIRQIQRSLSLLRAGPNNVAYENLVVTLRFVKDGFRARLHELIDPSDVLHNAVVELWNTQDLMKQKHAAEHLCLIPTQVAAKILSYILSSTCGWLKRTALAEARYISDLQPSLGARLARYASQLSEIDFLLFFRMQRATLLMDGAQQFDQFALYINMFLRMAIVLTFFASVDLMDEFVLGSIFGMILLALMNIAMKTFHTGIMQSISNQGFNRGLSGFLAYNIVLRFLWEFIHAALSKDPKVPLPRNIPNAVFDVILFTSIIALWAVNYSLRIREATYDEGMPYSVRTVVGGLKFPAVDWSYLLPAIIVISWLLSRWWSWMSVVSDAVFIFFVLALIGSGLTVVLRGTSLFILRVRDRFVHQRLVMNFEPSRRCVVESLYQLKTSDGKMHFIDWLDSRSENFKALGDPEDQWPDAQRPLYEDFKVNNFLAILDEKWRGLTR